jgi:hypothetical protein
VTEDGGRELERSRSAWRAFSRAVDVVLA